MRQDEGNGGGKVLLLSCFCWVMEDEYIKKSNRTAQSAHMARPGPAGQGCVCIYAQVSADATTLESMLNCRGDTVTLLCEDVTMSSGQIGMYTSTLAQVNISL